MTIKAFSADEPGSVESFRQERDALFEKRRSRRPTASTNATASEAAEIQKSLIRTQKLLQNSVTQVASARNAIEDDGERLRETMDTHKTLNVAGAKRALTALEREKQKERRVLTVSILFFWTAVFYVMWCRILIRIPFLDRITVLFPILVDGLSKLLALVIAGLGQLVGKIIELVEKIKG